MKSIWLSSVVPIAAIFSFRMLGLFMLIPVFTLFAPALRDATPELIGIALGSYGLTQGLLQIPFGMLSDRWGRKPILTLGLLLFAMGSVWGALTDSIYGMIIARMLQGTGAIGSVLIALLADLTPVEQRTKAMAVIGGTIGLSFSIAFLISPILTNHWGLSSIFYVAAGLAFLGLVFLHGIIPTPAALTAQPPKLFLKDVLRDRQLMQLDAGIFFQHLILTSTFFTIPLLLKQAVSLQHLTHAWQFYLPLLFGSFICMIPIIIYTEKRKSFNLIFRSSVLFTCLSQALLAFSYLYWWPFCLLLFVYFIAFNVLEANLPALISKKAPSHVKGTAMGIYSSCQFLGIFVGGSLAGLVYPLTGSKGLFIMNAAISLVWLFFSRIR